MDVKRIQKQLEKLKNPVCELDWAQKKYGIDFRANKQLLGRFRAWALRFKYRKDVIDSMRIDRFAFETFMHFSKLIPLKYAAIQIGTDEISLKKIMTEMQDRGLITYQIDLDFAEIIEESFVKNFAQLFPQLDGMIFDSHSSFCEAIHDVVHRDLQIKLKPLFCVTSELIDESPEYAYEYDALTDEPMGVRYQLWMDTEKPIILKPDACSMLTYFRCKNHFEIKLIGNYYYDDRMIDVKKKLMSKNTPNLQS